MRFYAGAALLALTACGSDSSDETSRSKVDAPFEVRDKAGATRVHGNAQASSEGVFALNPDGIVITHGTAKGRPVTLLQFGDAQDRTVAALAAELGQPRLSENAQCDTGPMKFADFGAIKASFQEGKFVGWVAEKGKGLKTGDGLSPDKSYRFLERIGAQAVPGSTLDGEFVLDGSGTGGRMGGIMEGGEMIRMLFAGSNCFFR